jgi:hypothetical protein
LSAAHKLLATHLKHLLLHKLLTVLLGSCYVKQQQYQQFRITNTMHLLCTYPSMLLLQRAAALEYALSCSSCWCACYETLDTPKCC